jgi:RNA polymerase sigma factor (sigma-70 family)
VPTFRFYWGALMSELKSGFQSLMEQIATGSEAAVTRLLSLYGDHLCRAVRRRLNRTLRPKFDTSDFVQAVWASFFCNRGEIAQFEHSAQLVAFLTRVANNKVIDECRHRQTQKADAARERSISDGSSEGFPVPGREPPASQIAIMHEEWERMVDGVPSRYRRIVELRAVGESQEEIADKLGVSEKTVSRVLNKLRIRMERGA